jgi:glycosyltransferase involved in cell wall biosynthesis
MPRVLLASNRYPPDYSGAGLRAQRFVGRMRNRHKRDFLIVCENKGNKPNKNPVSPSINRLNLGVETGINFPIYLIKAYRACDQLLRENAKKISVVHLFSFSWLNRMLMLANIKYRLPTILEITLDGDDDPTSLLRKGKRNRLMRWITKSLLKRIDKFIVLSQHAKNSCIREGFSVDRIWVRPNPCDESLFGAIPFTRKMALRKKLGLEDKLLILNVGIIQPRKNQFFLCKCMKHLIDSNVVLLFIGPIDQKNQVYYEELKSFVKQNNLSGNVRFVGPVDNINEYMIASDIFAFSSLKEGFPNVLAESLVSGLPVISLDFGSNAKYINEKTGILIRETNYKGQIEHFVSAVKEIENGSIKFNRPQIRNYGLQNFSSQMIDEKYEILFRELEGTHDR